MFVALHKTSCVQICIKVVGTADSVHFLTQAYRLQPSEKISVKCLFQGCNSIAVVKFELLITIGINGTPTNLPPYCKIG